MTDLKRDLNAYLGDLEESQVRSLADVIDYNIKHADVELPPGKRSDSTIAHLHLVYTVPRPSEPGPVHQGAEHGHLT